MTALPGMETPVDDAHPDGAGAPHAAVCPTGPAGPTGDPLEHPDAYTAADAAGTESLLRCWVRETCLDGPKDGVLWVPLPASGGVLLVPVRHWSPVGHHRFGTPWLASAPEAAVQVDAVTLAALLAREAAAGTSDGIAA